MRRRSGPTDTTPEAERVRLEVHVGYLDRWVDGLGVSGLLGEASH
jgi:hypothetical protein